MLMKLKSILYYIIINFRLSVSSMNIYTECPAMYFQILEVNNSESKIDKGKKNKWYVYTKSRENLIQSFQN